MILSLFLIWRIGLFLVTFLGTTTFPLVANGGIGAANASHGFDFFKSWAQWDGGYYYNIAQHGFINDKDFAFFPLYPILIHYFAKLLFGNYLLSGLLISNLSSFLVFSLFYKLVKTQYSKKIAFSALITLITFPTSFYLVAYYSESLFLLFLIMLFLFLKSKNYYFSSLAISLLSITRITGVFAVISAIYSYLAKKNFKFRIVDRNLFFIIFAPITLFIYCLFLFKNYHDPLKFLTIESLWKRSLMDPVATFSSYIFPMLTFQKRPINDYFDLGISLLFLITLILGRKKIPSSWWIFSIYAILIPASTGTLTSMPRYLITCFGAFVIFGKFLQDKKSLSIFIWIIGLSLQAFLAVLFLSGRWVA